MAKFNVDAEEMTEKQAKETLEKIIEALDELDSEDYFGTEGWKHFMGFES
jgi:hypothetical protein